MCDDLSSEGLELRGVLKNCSIEARSEPKKQPKESKNVTFAPESYAAENRQG